VKGTVGDSKENSELLAVFDPDGVSRSAGSAANASFSFENSRQKQQEQRAYGALS